MELEEFLNAHRNIWKTDATFWAWLRGGLRKAVWNKHPVKLTLLKKKRKKLPIGRAGRLVWAIKCACCEKWFRETEVVVDHIIPAGSLLSLDDIKQFVTRLALVGEEDLQPLCNHHPLSCHKIKTHAERYDMTFEEAKARKIEIKNKGGSPTRKKKARRRNVKRK